ncbi:MAG TPA: hypothetical protein VMW01_06780 [Williamwhitmania sp.]|nr:hypothetical protein [Williamwhitmania sp.]
MEDFGWAGDEFLMGDCQDDWHQNEGGWDDFEERECFLEQCAEEASKFDQQAEEEAEGLPFAQAWRDGFDGVRDDMEW